MSSMFSLTMTTRRWGVCTFLSRGCWTRRNVSCFRLRYPPTSICADVILSHSTSIVSSCKTMIRRSDMSTVPSSRRKKEVKSSATEAAAGTGTSLEYDFDKEMNRLLTNIYDGVLPMKDVNEEFSVTLNPEMCSLIIETLRGNFSLTSVDAADAGVTAASLSSESKFLRFQTYISGVHHYSYIAQEDVWRSVQDDHDIRGLITRDLLKHCAGCPMIK